MAIFRCAHKPRFHPASAPDGEHMVPRSVELPPADTTRYRCGAKSPGFISAIRGNRDRNATVLKNSTLVDIFPTKLIVVISGMKTPALHVPIHRTCLTMIHRVGRSRPRTSLKATPDAVFATPLNCRIKTELPFIRAQRKAQLSWRSVNVQRTGYNRRILYSYPRRHVRDIYRSCHNVLQLC
jgi:hypothetical protein